MSSQCRSSSKKLPHGFHLLVLAVEMALELHVVELLLKTIDAARLNCKGQLIVVGLVGVEAAELAGQLPVHSGELVEHLLRTHPGIVRLCR